jgi:hypothetical protein
LVHVTERYGDERVRQLTRATLLALTRKIALSQPTQGHELHKVAKAWLNWCVQQGAIEYNPLARSAAPARPERKQKHLAVDDIARIFIAVQTLGNPWAAIIQLLILSGESVETIRTLHVKQICFDRKKWALEECPPWDWPQGWRSISPACAAILEEHKVAREFLFALERRGGSPRPPHLRPSILRAIHKASGVSGWTWRDLVRSIATLRTRGQPSPPTTPDLDLSWHAAIESRVKTLSIGAVDDIQL